MQLSQNTTHFRLHAHALHGVILDVPTDDIRTNS